MIHERTLKEAVEQSLLSCEDIQVLSKCAIDFHEDQDCTIDTIEKSVAVCVLMYHYGDQTLIKQVHELINKLDRISYQHIEEEE